MQQTKIRSAATFKQIQTFYLPYYQNKHEAKLQKETNL